MKFSLKILETEAQIQKEILTALLDPCTTFMNKAILKIKSELPQIIYSAITNRQEYVSLTTGQLRLEFGIPDAGAKVASLLNFWISNIQYNYKEPKISGKQIKASFSIEMIKSDFKDVLGLSEAYVVDSIRGYSLPWLEWLLVDGNFTIVPKHEVVLGPRPGSRTGEAVMRISSSDWKVPAEYAGTIADNWITRSIDDASMEIEKLLERALS